MFVGWPRASFEQDLEQFSQQILCDTHLTLQSYQAYPGLTYVAYEGDTLQGYIGAYLSEKRVIINSFDYIEGLDDGVKERLIALLLQNIDRGAISIEVLTHISQEKIFEKFGFATHSRFSQALYSGDAVPFNFSTATAKRISTEHFVPTLKRIDKKAYKEDRFEYISSMMKQSSLMLSTPNGYQHSAMIDKGLLKISPWVMEDAAYTDAEQLIRGVIYHRGLKKILAYIPSDTEEIVKLYSSYNFKLTDDMLLMYKNQEPKIDLEMVYAY